MEGDGLVLWEQPMLNPVTGVCDRSELLLRTVEPLEGSLLLSCHLRYIAKRYGQI